MVAFSTCAARHEHDIQRLQWLGAIAVRPLLLNRKVACQRPPLRFARNVKRAKLTKTTHELNHAVPT